MSSPSSWQPEPEPQNELERLIKAAVAWEDERKRGQGATG